MIFINDYCLSDSSVRVAYSGEELYWLIACLAGRERKVTSELSDVGNWIYAAFLTNPNI